MPYTRTRSPGESHAPGAYEPAPMPYTRPRSPGHSPRPRGVPNGPSPRSVPHRSGIVTGVDLRVAPRARTPEPYHPGPAQRPHPPRQPMAGRMAGPPSLPHGPPGGSPAAPSLSPTCAAPAPGSGSGTGSPTVAGLWAAESPGTWYPAAVASPTWQQPPARGAAPRPVSPAPRSLAPRYPTPAAAAQYRPTAAVESAGSGCAPYDGPAHVPAPHDPFAGRGHPPVAAFAQPPAPFPASAPRPHPYCDLRVPPAPVAQFAPPALGALPHFSPGVRGTPQSGQSSSGFPLSPLVAVDSPGSPVDSLESELLTPRTQSNSPDRAGANLWESRGRAAHAQDRSPLYGGGVMLQYY